MSTEYFERRERALLGGRYEALYAAPTENAARGVTVSALRTTPEAFAGKADFPLRPSPFCKAGFVVEEAAFKPGRHPYHHAGVFYSQEPSASSAAPLLGVRPGMRVLDLCAAPGGKSSQLAAALGGWGLLVSNEYVPARAEVLKSNLERMGVANAVVLNEDTARIAAALPEFFDRVLVDAPCSGEGMFRKEAVAVTQHCEALVQQCAALGAQDPGQRCRRPRAGRGDRSTPPAPLPPKRMKGRWPRSWPGTRNLRWRMCLAMWTTRLAARARPTAPAVCRWM